MIVIDTSILIDAFHGKEAALGLIRDLEKKDETLCTTQINVLELFKGAYRHSRSDKGLERVRKLLDALAILKIDDEVYDMFGDLSAELSRRGEAIGDFDELIASITLSNGASIASSDPHFLLVPGLRVIAP